MAIGDTHCKRRWKGEGRAVNMLCVPFSFSCRSTTLFSFLNGGLQDLGEKESFFSFYFGWGWTFTIALLTIIICSEVVDRNSAFKIITQFVYSVLLSIVISVALKRCCFLLTWALFLFLAPVCTHAALRRDSAIWPCNVHRFGCAIFSKYKSWLARINSFCILVE